MRFLLAGLFAFVGACANPSEGTHPGSPADVVTAVGMTTNELAHFKDEEDVLGCALSIVGGRATFIVCSAEDACGPRTSTIDAKAVQRVKAIGRARPMRSDGTLGDEAEVVSMTLARNSATSRGGAAVDPRGLVTGGSQKP